MLLFTVSPVDHTETGHAQGSAVFVDGDGIRDGLGPAAVTIQVDEGAYLPFLAEGIGGIVVIGRIQAEVTDRDIRIDGHKFAEGNDSAYAVMSPGIEEADMEREVNSDVCIMRAEHVKGMAEIKDFLVTVPSPVSIRVREMAHAGAVGYAVIQTVTDFMSVRGGMRMDAGTVAGKNESVSREKAVIQGRDEGGKAKELLKPHFIMEGKFFMGEGVSGNGFGDVGMFIRKFLPFTRFFGRLFVLMGWEQIFPAGSLQMSGLSPEPVHEVKIRAKGRQGTGSTANKDGKEAVGPEFFDPGGKTCKAEHYHKDKGTDDLGLVFGWTSQRGIEAGKVFHDGIQVQQPKFFPNSAKFKLQP